MLFRAAMMIDGKQHAALRAAGTCKVDGGFPAIAADLQTGAARADFKRKLIEPGALIGVEKALNLVGI